MAVRQRPGPKPRNLVGREFGRLRVLGEGTGRARSDGRNIRTWRCRCECGTEEVEIRGPDLTSGHTTSCGCVKGERPGGRPPKRAAKPEARASRRREVAAPAPAPIEPAPRPSATRAASRMDG